MFSLKDIRMRPKLIGLFLLVGLLPLAFVGWFSSDRSTDSLMFASFNQLKSVREIKKVQIENYFKERQGDMGVLVETVNTLRQEAFRKLEALRNVKKSQIEGYFSERFGDVTVLSSNDTVVDAIGAFETAFEADGGKTGGQQWQDVVKKYGPWLKEYSKEYGYYSMFKFSVHCQSSKFVNHQNFNELGLDHVLESWKIA